MDIKKMHEELVSRCRYNKVQDNNIINYVSHILNCVAISCDNINLIENICHDLYYTYDYEISDDLLNAKSLRSYFIVIDSVKKLVCIKDLQEVVSNKYNYSFLSDAFVYDLLSIASATISTDIGKLIFKNFFRIEGVLGTDVPFLFQIVKYIQYIDDISFMNDNCILNSKITNNGGCSLSKHKFICLIDFVVYMNVKNNRENENKQTLECKIKKETTVSNNKEYIIIDKCRSNNKESFVRIILKKSEIRSIHYDLNRFCCYDYYLLTITFIDGKTMEVYISRSDYDMVQKCILE